jgi:hypothetical protein
MQQRSSHYRRWLLPVLGGALLLTSAACNDDNGLVNRVLVATSISASSGDAQVGAAGQALAQPIVVHVLNQIGNSLQNAVVSWTVLSGGGSVSASTSLTDANGNASVTWTLGPAAGANSLRAAIANGNSVTFTATAQ